MSLDYAKDNRRVPISNLSPEPFDHDMQKHAEDDLAYAYRLAKNAFGRWILVNADDPALAWSGSRFVPVDENGFPAGNAQVSNFDSEEDARHRVPARTDAPPFAAGGIVSEHPLAPDDFEDDCNFGQCCACHGTKNVRTVVMLHRRGPVPGTGWGCVVCDLPLDGAISVVCDSCRLSVMQSLAIPAKHGY